MANLKGTVVVGDLQVTNILDNSGTLTSSKISSKSLLFRTYAAGTSLTLSPFSGTYLILEKSSGTSGTATSPVTININSKSLKCSVPIIIYISGTSGSYRSVSIRASADYSATSPNSKAMTYWCRISSNATITVANSYRYLEAIKLI